MRDKNIDAYHITVAGVNPHDIAVELDKEGSPFHDEISHPGVAQHIIVDGELVGGIVEVWASEHFTPEQEKYVQEHSHVIDVRHAWPE